eukprot:m.7695 g.7695  ORF g.7695 m.7695 type:complete len:76 (+) comp8922_c1_seq1:598-825(+)
MRARVARKEREHKAQEEIVAKATSSLSSCYSCEYNLLRQQLKHWFVLLTSCEVEGDEAPNAAAALQYFSAFSTAA